jgi:hypothetical protein
VGLDQGERGLFGLLGARELEVADDQPQQRHGGRRGLGELLAQQLVLLQRPFEVAVPLQLGRLVAQPLDGLVILRRGMARGRRRQPASGRQSDPGEEPIAGDHVGITSKIRCVERPML